MKREANSVNSGNEGENSVNSGKKDEKGHFLLFIRYSKLNKTEKKKVGLKPLFFRYFEKIAQIAVVSRTTNSGGFSY